MLNSIIKILHIGTLPDDTLEKKLQKQFLVFLALFMSMGGIIWGSICFYYDLYTQSIIPFSYTIITILNLLYFNHAKKFNTVKFIQTGISLMLPFFFQSSLGGFAPSGAIMFWSILALLASITFQSKSTSYFWLAGFLILTIVIGIFDDYFYTLKPVILPDYSLIFLLTNMTIIPSIVFGLMLYIVKKQEMTQKILYEKQDEITIQNRELNQIYSEIKKHKETLEIIVEERTKSLLENEERLKGSLIETRETNYQLIQAEEELRQNIEELRATQEQAEKAREQAEQANKAKSEFLANMSHEIRTPLNAIVGFSQILVKRGLKHELSHSFIQQLEYIKTGGQNLSELINNILDLSKIESGKMTASFEPLNIKQLFQGIYHINKGKANEKNINFSFDFDSNIPEVVESDRTKLNQILMNLVGNSIKFTPDGKDVKITADRENQHILIKVTDTGIGIEDNKKPIIFDAFEQADTSITRKYGGSGLGLAITKKMVKLLNGEIGFDSEINKGTSFWVRIPLIESKESVNEQGDYNFSRVRFSKDNVILVAEDNEMNREMIKSLFRELDLEIHFAENGKVAIEKTKKLSPDIVLMDMHMPLMGGIDATKIIRENKKFEKLPIIALSADAFSDQQKFAISNGLTDYITKPIDFNKLMPILEKYLKLEKSETEEIQNIDKKAIPADLSVTINKEMVQLSMIPAFNFEEIDEQIVKIRLLIKDFDTELTGVLKKIENAFMDADEGALKELLKFRI